MAVLMVPPYLQFLDNNGLPLAGGFVGTYSSGTDTPKATYTDNTEGTPADNPVELDAYGRATIWVNGSYRFKVYDSAMNLLRTTNGVTSFSVPAASANAYFESFSGTGAQTAYTTSSDLGTDEKAILVWVDAGAGKGYEIQNPSTYTIAATALTFAVAPASGTNNIYVTAPSLLLGAASSSAAAAATSETNAAASAVLASQWATLTSGIVAATDYSAKAWAIGGTGVTGIAAKGAAKEWAITTGAAVDTSEFSSKEYAVGTTATTGSAKSWATLTSGLVATVDGSAKAWAIGGTGISATSAKGAAKEWAITTGAAVDTSEFSSKEYAVGTTATAGSAKSWATLTSGLVMTIDGSAKAWAIGGTGISATSGKGAAKEWAVKTSAAVDTTDFSAKEYAQGTQAATGGSAKNWAQQTGADITGASANDRSSKSWAQENIAGATLGGSAKDWAQSASKPDGTLESAKTYATNAGIIAAGCLATSTTSLLIAVASKTFTTQAGKQFQAGSYIIATSAANPANYMHGQVTSYSSTTLIVDVQDIGGSGTLADWNISLSGTRGTIGATGATGSIPIAAAGGTADAITADYTPDLTLTNQVTCFVVAGAANATTTPTFAPDGLTARTITKKGGTALSVGDIAASGHCLLLEYNLAGTRWELLNPAKVTASDIINPTQLQDGGTVGGTANAITLTPTPALGAYAAKDTRTFIAGSTNTGSVTMNVSGLGAVTLKKFIGGAPVVLVAGDIVANTIVHLIHDGTQYLVMNPAMHAQGADVASSGTTNLDTATGDYVNITGTTSITAITLAQGRECTVKFAGILTLTNGASLILPSGANITTAAGDTAIFRGEASSVVRCVSYTKADGTAVVAASSFGDSDETTGSSSITLTSSSKRFKWVAMTAAGKWVKLPDATTMTRGLNVMGVRNTGAYPFTVIDTGGQAIAILMPGEGAVFSLSNISTSKGRWYAGKSDQSPISEILYGDQTNGITANPTNNTQQYCAAYISDQKFLFGWIDSSGTATAKCCVISITDADTLSAGAVITLATAASLTSGCMALCPMDASNVLAQYSYTSVNSVVVVGISGTTASAGTPASVAATICGNSHLFKISANSAFYGFVSSTTSKGVVLSAMSTAGITVNSVATCRASTTAQAFLSVTQGDVNTYFYATVGTTSYLDVQLVTVSSVTVTANTAVANSSASTAIAGTCAIALNVSTYLVAYIMGNAILWAVFRVSTGTTLEKWYGADKYIDGGGTGANAITYCIDCQGVGPPMPAGWIMLDNMLVLMATYSAGGYYITKKYYFRYEQNTKSVAFVYSMNHGEGAARSDPRGAFPPFAKVSEGKYAYPYTALSGATVPKIAIIHGIVNPL